MNSAERQGDAEPRAQTGEHDRFGEQLADNASPGSANGGANCELMLPRCSSSQQQDGDVGAPDKKQQGNRGEEQDEGAAKLPEQLLIEAQDVDVQILGEVKAVGLRPARGHVLQLGRGL